MEVVLEGGKVGILNDISPKPLLGGTGAYWPIFKNVNRQVATVRPMQVQKPKEQDPKKAHVPCLMPLSMLTPLCIKAKCHMNPEPCHGNRVDFKRLLPLGEGVYQEEYEIEAIVDHQDCNGDYLYLIKWKGWDSIYNTWEPSTNLTNSLKLLEEYKRKASTIKSLQKKYGKNYLAVIEKQKQLLDIINAAVDNQDVATLLKLSGKTLLEFQEAKLKTLSGDLINIVNNYEPSKKHALPKILLTEILNSEEDVSSHVIHFVEKRREVLVCLKRWQDSMNALKGMQMPIEVENHVDLEGPPVNFTYITDYKPEQGILINDDPPIGCECIGSCYENRRNCCASMSNCQFAYNMKGTLVIPHGTPLYECNKRCMCKMDCANRVVQKGRSIRLAIFRTHNGRGWGIKTLERIRKGCFVMEYVGEVIRSAEAERRGRLYEEEGRTYLFDLDFEGHSEYTVDAGRFGNVAHFMNHSCNPNLEVYVVWINNLDKNLPRIAFFSKKDIKKGEELTFDYKMSEKASTCEPTSPRQVMTSRIGNQVPVAEDQTPLPSKRKKTVSIDEDEDGLINSVQDKKRVLCKCGADNCRRYLF